MGTTLIHEHVFIDWAGADSTNPSTWNNDEAYELILPYLEEVKAKGVTTILDATPITSAEILSFYKDFQKQQASSF